MFYLLLLFLFQNEAVGLPVSSILRAKSSLELQQMLDQENRLSFLKKMCQKESLHKKIPVSCYDIGDNNDALCLSLELSDVRNLPEIVKARQSKSLSVKCREHLKKKEEILRYRQKDFLLPELKNYWTDEKNVP